jgi:hypothetical protein
MAKSTYSKGEFAMRNPQKYMGKLPAIYRSSWEMTLMQVLDQNPAVLGWSSESISIPYQNPLTGKWSMYIPDFLAIYMDRNNSKHVEIIEIKPLKEHPNFTGNVSTRTRLTQAINQAKWTAALIYCKKRGWSFRIMTEKDLFGRTGRPSKK